MIVATVNEVRSGDLLGIVLSEVEISPLLQFLEEEGVRVLRCFVARKTDVLGDVHRYLGDTLQERFELKT